jgi:tRNA threonylcarbamoyladenosine biosynthesis protein TsaE
MLVASILAFELSDISKVANKVIDACQYQYVWLFEGQMGAGKTTLIKEICRAFGVIDTVQSPTFSIVNEYLTDKDESIYHFDCYRLKNEMEAFDIGIEEYLDSGNLCLIEWADKIPSFIPDQHAVIRIKEILNGKRQIEVFVNG